jgi:hypothetical protein
MPSEGLGFTDLEYVSLLNYSAVKSRQNRLTVHLLHQQGDRPDDGGSAHL